MKKKPRVAAFASGEGSLFQHLYHRQESLKFNFKLLVSSKETSGAVSFAKRHQLPVVIYDQSNPLELKNKLVSYKIDVIFLLGFLKSVPEEIVSSYKGRILNTHPSLLPKFGGKGMYGLNVHRAVLAANEKFSGCTLHYVTEKYDEGPILSQKTIAIAPGETPASLQDKIKQLEMVNFIEALPHFF